MCELLVRVVDAGSSDDPYLDVSITKNGYVICLFDDDWGWSAIERTNSFWRILKLPGVPAGDMQKLVYTEAQVLMYENHGGDENPLANPVTNPMLRPRAWVIDMTALSDDTRKALAKARINDGSLVVTKEEIDSAIVRLGPAEDPSFIGGV